MARRLDFRVQAQANFEVSVYRTTEHVIISIAERDGIGLEAVISPAQAEHSPTI